MQYNEILCKPKQNNQIQSNTMQYHAVQSNTITLPEAQRTQRIESGQ